MEIPFKKRKFWIWLVIPLLLIWFIPHVWVFYFNSIEVDRFPRGEKKLKSFIVGPGVSGWTSISKLPPQIYNAFVAAEDGKFYSHWGIDLESLIKSFKYNVKKKRYARGGSTITQQLVKISLLSPHKSIVRKAREAAGAVLVETLLSKKRILEWYLNLVELGDGIYGIDAAARNYFGVSAYNLKLPQAVQLATILPSPKAWSKGLRNHSLDSFEQSRFAAIITNMRLEGFIKTADWQEAMATGNFGQPITNHPKVFEQAIRALRAHAEPVSKRIEEDDLPDVTDQSPEQDENPAEAVENPSATGSSPEPTHESAVEQLNGDL